MFEKILLIILSLAVAVGRFTFSGHDLSLGGSHAAFVHIWAGVMLYYSCHFATRAWSVVILLGIALVESLLMEGKWSNWPFVYEIMAHWWIGILGCVAFIPEDRFLPSPRKLLGQALFWSLLLLELYMFMRFKELA